MAIEKGIYFLRGCRLSGKTEAGILFAIERALAAPKSKVVFVTAFDSSRELEKTARECGSKFSNKTGNKLHLVNESTIEFMSARSMEIRKGLKADALVVDNMNCFKMDEAYGALVYVAGNKKMDVLITSTGTKGTGEKMLKELQKNNEVFVHNYDYLDLIEEGKMTASNVRELKASMSKKTFKNEFGPYYERDVKLTNEQLKDLLAPEKDAV